MAVGAPGGSASTPRSPGERTIRAGTGYRCLLEVVNGTIENIAGVNAVETLVYLKLLKLSYQAGVWPTTT